MPEKKKVYLSEFIHPGARKVLETYADIVSDWDAIDTVEGLINRNLVKIDNAVLDRAKKLKVIGIHGTGKDGVDLDAAEAHGVEVFSTPGINARSVAELNVALVLNLYRKIQQAQEQIYHSENTKQLQSKLRGHELYGKTVGIIGMGNIGTLSAAIFQHGFGCKVIAWSRSLTEEKAAELGIEAVPQMEDVLKQADIILLALASTPETYHMIGAQEFACCKNTAVFINTARGKIVDEASLYGALTEGQIAGAACDVFEQEPVSRENPLLSLENFVATPHLGANTEEALYRVGMEVVTGVLQRLGVPYR